MNEAAYPDEKSMSNYMENNKTDCALKIFDTNIDIEFPQYILNAINWEYEQE
jgi:putative ATP-dependent endonuclease of OLD family